MEKTVTFRDFEERDIDFIYKCKNDEKLNSMIVGQFKPFSYEDAVKWVHGCMGEHDTFKFWAIATNNEEQRIVGWVSISEINHYSKTAMFHGIVIGDKSYRNGFAWIESYLYILSYVFDKLGFYRFGDSCLCKNSSSMTMNAVMNFHLDGVLRQICYKNGKYYDKAMFSILREEYLSSKGNGDYEIKRILGRIKDSLIKSKQ